jgi:hypothetical protein
VTVDYNPGRSLLGSLIDRAGDDREKLLCLLDQVAPECLWTNRVKLDTSADVEEIFHLECSGHPWSRLLCAWAIFDGERRGSDRDARWRSWAGKARAEFAGDARGLGYADFFESVVDWGTKGGRERAVNGCERVIDSPELAGDPIVDLARTFHAHAHRCEPISHLLALTRGS